MKPTVLVTGGAGFIGSFLVDRLVTEGYRVRILDSLVAQVHGGKKPSYLNKRAQFIKGDVRDATVVRRALTGADVIYHLASRVGVGQSNYEIKDYVDINVGGMATLLDAIVNGKRKPKKIIVTSSMTSYGEGDYRCPSCGKVKPHVRTREEVKRYGWEPRCPSCRKKLTVIATDEDSPLTNNSVYSLTKHMQEQLLFHTGKLYKIPAVSLRCFNVYGPRQSLSNPYTGVAAIFISRLKNNKAPVVYEDGNQSRDFVSVHDVVNALLLAMERENADNKVFNIGSGKGTHIMDLARMLSNLMKVSIAPTVNGEFRTGDIRHCEASIEKARKILGWKPRIRFQDGLVELIAWSKKEQAHDRFTHAAQELIKRGLTHDTVR